MTRTEAWNHYFATGDREPLVKAYWDSIQYMAWDHFRTQQEDYFQIGMMGLLKAIDKIDKDRVRSKDAWVFLNVRGMMFNARRFPATETLFIRNKTKAGTSTPPLIDMIEGYDDPTGVYVDDLLAQLPEREAFIIRKVHLEGYKRTDVAKMFGLSSMRIGQLEQQGLKRLRDGQ